MAKPLSELERVNLTSLSFEGLIDLLHSIIEQDNDFDSIEDFLDSNAGRVLADFFAFFTSQFLKRLDISMQEAFIGTARQPDSVLKLLKLIGAKVRSTTAASVPVTVTISPVPTSDFELPVRYPLTATDLNGDEITFEILDSVDDYTTPVTIPAGTSSIELQAYAGLTVIQDIEINVRENFTYQLQQFPVIEDSVQLFLETSPEVYEEMSIYDNFLNPLESVPMATLETDFDGKKTIRTGTKDLGGSFDTIIENDPSTFLNMRSFYRIGGGKATNIYNGAIQKSASLYVPSQATTFQITFINTENAGGGADVQTLEDVKRNAPLQAKTGDRSVTNEDGEILMNSMTNIKDSMLITPLDEPKQNIPIFHTNIYVAPVRSWSNFIPANPASPGPGQIPESLFLFGETQSEYIERLIAAANDFLNLSGIAENTVATTSGTNSGPFTINVGNNLLKLNVDTQGEVNVVLTNGVRTTTQIANNINSTFGFSLATVDGDDQLVLTSPTPGGSGSVEVVKSTAVNTLGLVSGIYTGDDNTGEAQALIDDITRKSPIGIGHIIKRTIFTPFFISGNIIASKTASIEALIPQIKQVIYDTFDYESDNVKFKRKIILSRITRAIMNIDGINEFTLLNPTSNKTPLTNEIFFMFGEDVLVALPNADYPNLSSQFGINLTISRELNDFVEI